MLTMRRWDEQSTNWRRFSSTDIPVRATLGQKCLNHRTWHGHPCPCNARKQVSKPQNVARTSLSVQRSETSVQATECGTDIPARATPGNKCPSHRMWHGHPCPCNARKQVSKPQNVAQTSLSVQMCLDKNVQATKCSTDIPVRANTLGQKRPSHKMWHGHSCPCKCAWTRMSKPQNVAQTFLSVQMRLDTNVQATECGTDIPVCATLGNKCPSHRMWHGHSCPCNARKQVSKPQNVARTFLSVQTRSDKSV